VTLALVSAAASAQSLFVAGAFWTAPDDDLPTAIGTVILLAPAEPGFWAHVRASPECHDGTPDPLDRWSRRVIGGLASELGGKAYFPFGSPPYRPFYRWALRSRRAWASPVTLLVHDTAGLMISYRGAIGLPGRLDLPASGDSPCSTCIGQPCRTACPAAALTTVGYDVAACHAFLDRQEGADCLSSGCAVRRACPVSRRYGRLPEQSAYHMRLFHT
jgi:hypothetical protein